MRLAARSLRATCGVAFACFQMLQIGVAQVEALLVPLILDGLVVGKIDQVKGLLDLTQRCPFVCSFIHHVCLSVPFRFFNFTFF